MKLRKSDYPIIATMKLSGSTWSEIGALYGVTSGHLRNLKSDIMEGYTVGDKFKRSSFGKSVAMHVALTSSDADTRLRASKQLIGTDTDTVETEATKDTSTVRLEILHELQTK